MLERRVRGRKKTRRRRILEMRMGRSEVVREERRTLVRRLLKRRTVVLGRISVI